MTDNFIVTSEFVIDTLNDVKSCRLFFPKNISVYFPNLKVIYDSNYNFVYTHWGKPSKEIYDIIQSNVPYYLCAISKNGVNKKFFYDGKNICITHNLFDESTHIMLDYMSTDEYKNNVLKIKLLSLV